VKQQDVISRIFTARCRDKCREKLTMRRWTKYLHIEGEEVGKNVEEIECEACDVILRPGDDARSVESKLNHIIERNLLTVLPDAALEMFFVKIRDRKRQKCFLCTP